MGVVPLTIGGSLHVVDLRQDEKTFFSARRQLRQSGTLLTAYNFYVTILHITTANTESESLDKGLEYVQIYFSLGEDGTSFPKKNMCRLS